MQIKKQIEDIKRTCNLENPESYAYKNKAVAKLSISALSVIRQLQEELKNLEHGLTTAYMAGSASKNDIIRALEEENRKLASNAHKISLIEFSICARNVHGDPKYKLVTKDFLQEGDLLDFPDFRDWGQDILLRDVKCSYEVFYDK